jgi:uncharacterized protein with HEPN domain
VLYVDDIIQACQNVIEFTVGLSQAELFKDKKTRDEDGR